MWTLTGLMFNYLLWSVIPTLRRIPEELLPQFLCDLQGLEKNFLSNGELWSHRSQDEVLHFAQIVSSLWIWLGRHHCDQIRSRFFKKQNRRIVRRRQYIERNNTGKLTFAVIFECRLCFYSGHSGMKSGVLRKLLMCKGESLVQTGT
jgi:hypothetical protein